VGSLAVTLLARRGHRVVASTGSPEHAEWLARLGASAVIARDAIADRPDRVLAGERWAGAIDCVGGDTLHQILRSLRYGAAVAASGLVASPELATTVYPFITRAVSLIGIDSVESTSERRALVWEQIARSARDEDVALVERVVGLEGVVDGIAAVGASATRGRWLVSARSV
jgi:putative YhdH/YhfP family quinone oxidoreductase